MLTNFILTDGISTVYTSANTNVIVSGFICNLHDSPVNVTVYLLPDSQTAEDRYKIYNEITIAAGDTYIVDTEKIILDNGESVAAVASVTDVVAVTLITMAI
jgi:uncharacterized Zn finger protein